MSILNIIQSVRQNHALEHATIHVLTAHHPYVRLVGRSTPNGFVIYGPLDTQDVAAGASEALARLQQGEEHLAVHPRCGTNLVVTSVLAGTAAYSASLGRRRSRLERLPLALAGATLAALVAQPLAHVVQERITTSPEVEDVYIDSVTRHEMGKLTGHKVVVGRS
jgi:hypothetical protein